MDELSEQKQVYWLHLTFPDSLSSKQILQNRSDRNGFNLEGPGMKDINGHLANFHYFETSFTTVCTIFMKVQLHFVKFLLRILCTVWFKIFHKLYVIFFRNYTQCISSCNEASYFSPNYNVPHNLISWNTNHKLTFKQKPHTYEYHPYAHKLVMLKLLNWQEHIAGCVVNLYHFKGIYCFNPNSNTDRVVARVF